MKLAITGGTGIIGKSLIKLLPENYSVVILSRNEQKNTRQTDPCICYRKTDYSIGSLRNIFQGCDAVIHLAAQRLQKEHPDTSFKNVLIDYNVFRACDILNITNIVFTSSRGVYGNNSEVPWKEEYDPTPENPYALGKLVSEKSAGYFNRNGLSIKCLRLAQILSKDAREEYVLGKFIAKSLNGESLELYATEDQKREYIYVKDVARGILAALQKPDIKGVFNLGSGEVVTIPELAVMINKTFNSNGDIKEHKPEFPQEEFSLMDSRLFYSTFEFQIQWTLQEALIDIYNSVNND